MIKSKQRGSTEIVILVIVLALVAGLIAWRIADTIKTQQDTEAAVSNGDQVPAGDDSSQDRVAAVLTFPDYQVSLKVIDADFEAGDIGFDKVDDYYALTSKTLREDSHELSCTEENGKFSSVTRTTEPEENGIGQEGKKIGDFYYYVLPLNLIDCYPGKYTDVFLSPEALNKIKNALVATSDL